MCVDAMCVMLYTHVYTHTHSFIYVLKVCTYMDMCTCVYQRSLVLLMYILWWMDHVELILQMQKLKRLSYTDKTHSFHPDRSIQVYIKLVFKPCD